MSRLMMSQLSQPLKPVCRALFSALQQQTRGKVTLPDLPYDYNALEPVISAKIMQLHHSKHHATYVNNLNVALEKLEQAESKQDLQSIIQLEPVIRFNGGGHLNHSLFWQVLCPVGTGGEPTGELLDAIKKAYGSVDVMESRLTALAIGVQGSGWAWLAMGPNTGHLRAVSTANQDPPEASGLIPLLGIDVWEHAYYLQYKNVRADYVKAIWSLINWKEVQRRYLAAMYPAECKAKVE